MWRHSELVRRHDLIFNTLRLVSMPNCRVFQNLLCKFPFFWNHPVRKIMLISHTVIIKLCSMTFPVTMNLLVKRRFPQWLRTLILVISSPDDGAEEIHKMFVHYHKSSQVYYAQCIKGIFNLIQQVKGEKTVSFSHSQLW